LTPRSCGLTRGMRLRQDGQSGPSLSLSRSYYSFDYETRVFLFDPNDLVFTWRTTLTPRSCGLTRGMRLRQDGQSGPSLDRARALKWSSTACFSNVCPHACVHTGRFLYRDQWW
jgi:hypothetical protein